MITIKRCFSLLCVGIILFSSCEKSSTPPHLQAIPADASFVVAVESKQLMKKGGLDHLKDYKFYQMINDNLSQEEPAMQEFIGKLIENPDASGIDLEQFYVYGLKQTDGFYAAATFLIDNQAAFEDNLDRLLRQEGDVRIDDKGNYKLIAPDRSTAFAWNERIFIVFGGDLENVDYGKSFSLSGDESILSVDDFREFQQQTYDAACWMSYGQLMDMAEENLNTSLPAYAREFSSMHIHLYLLCTDGEIKITGKYTPKSALDEFYAKYPIVKKDFNSRLLEDFPETTYLAVKFAINWQAYIELISSASASDYTHDFQAVLESPEVKTVIDGLAGDFLLSLYGFAQGPFPIPLAGISFSVKSEDDFNRILSLIPEGMLQKTDDFYTINLLGAVTISVAFKDGRVFITDDADAITAFTGKGYSKSLKNSPLASSLKNDPALFYLNLDLSSYPGNIRTLLQNETPPVAKPAIDFLETCKDISFGTDKDNEFYLSLKFKDSKQNGLKLLIKNLDEIAAQ